MIAYCTDPSSDPHGDIAKKAYFIEDFDKSKPDHSVLRAAAKNGFVFPELYGSYYKNCASNLACDWGKLPPEGRWTVKQGIDFEGDSLGKHLGKHGIKSLDGYIEHIRKVENEFFEMFPVHKKYMDETYQHYMEHGYVDTFTGFRCKGLMSRNNVLNYPIQGSAFHCLLWSFIELDRILREDRWDSKIVGQIHDAIVFDVHPDELEELLPLIRRVTCQDLPKAWPWIVVPLEIDAEITPIDGSWAEKEEIAI
jgi:hypothetical protein